MKCYVTLTGPNYRYGWHDAAYVNTAKMMEMILNGGRCLDCAARTAPAGAGTMKSDNIPVPPPESTVRDIIKLYEKTM